MEAVKTGLTENALFAASTDDLNFLFIAELANWTEVSHRECYYAIFIKSNPLAPVSVTSLESHNSR